ncbi:hypothetical protein SK224_08285 [Microbacterium sp. BG28]|uniref:hypothetical protein n=1 Tax=Microbacterium sp. BG28 TaxID=3097356 RepID=UPI002A5AEFF2|nr:hypothetical protein [Microbacterium sp. BG28]MDY0829122.1 hypothetical protein [Microbacterium sp. BG28]
MPFDGLVVLALSARDANDWRAEHAELAESARIVIGSSWDALRGIYPTTLSLGASAAAAPGIGGSQMPHWISLALELGERRRGR